MVSWVSRKQAEEFPNGKDFMRHFAAISRMPLQDFIKEDLKNRDFSEQEIAQYKTMGEFLVAWLDSLKEEINRNGDLLPQHVSQGKLVDERDFYKIFKNFLDDFTNAQELVDSHLPIRLDKDKMQHTIDEHRRKLQAMIDTVFEVDIHNEMQPTVLHEKFLENHAEAAKQLAGTKPKNFTQQVARFLLDQLNEAVEKSKSPPLPSL